MKVNSFTLNELISIAMEAEGINDYNAIRVFDTSTKDNASKNLKKLYLLALVLTSVGWLYLSYMCYHTTVYVNKEQ